MGVKRNSLCVEIVCVCVLCMLVFFFNVEMLKNAEKSLFESSLKKSRKLEETQKC